MTIYAGATILGGDTVIGARLGHRRQRLARRLGAARQPRHRRPARPPVSDAASALAPPPKPLGVRALNAAGGALRALGLPLVRLDEASLLAEASRDARASTTSATTRFREPLAPAARLVRARGARSRSLGRVIARTRPGAAAREPPPHGRCTRAPPRDRRGADPAPLFIVGLPRTGTTILHELLAQDPREPRADDVGGEASVAAARGARPTRPTRASPRSTSTSPASTASCPTSRRCIRWARACRRSASRSRRTTSRR